MNYLSDYDHDKYVILCELIKYVYYQTDEPNIKRFIFDVMSNCDEDEFLVNLDYSYSGTAYSTVLELGYEYERFFSLNSLRFAYGDEIPKRIYDKTYFPQKVLVDNIWFDSCDNTYEYFKVMFHKHLREITNQSYLSCQDRKVNLLYALCDHVIEHCEDLKFTRNVIWVKNICNPPELQNKIKTVNNNNNSFLCKYFSAISLNTIFFMISQLSTNFSNKVID